MKASKIVSLKVVLTLVLFIVCSTIEAQVKYDSTGRLTIGPTEPFLPYGITHYGNGMYLKCKTSNFFQIDVTPAATRLASHYDQVVFYNTQTNLFNSIQVKNVYNYSDTRAKKNIQTLKNGLSAITKLNPVSYDFNDNADNTKFRKGGNGKEIGLLAQEVEEVLPNVVLTDDDGKKLINYTALIPVLIDAIKSLQEEVDALKKSKK